MSLKQRLQNDWKEALKARQKSKASTLSMAKAAVLQIEKDSGSEVTDEQVTEAIAKEVKQRRESIVEFKKGNRQDLVDKAEDEIEILLEYLPKQISEDEVTEIVRQVVDEVGANSMKDMGMVMSSVIPKVKGRADGKLVNKIVREYLSN